MAGRGRAFAVLPLYQRPIGGSRSDWFNNSRIAAAGEHSLIPIRPIGRRPPPPGLRHGHREHAQKMAAHAAAKTTKLYDRRDDPPRRQKASISPPPSY